MELKHPRHNPPQRTVVSMPMAHKIAQARCIACNREMNRPLGVKTTAEGMFCRACRRKLRNTAR